ncbi:MAG TPA: ATP-binding protein [Gemmatimonadales bacterium]|nr:ATP-binding protein [Gemmatimonadales bacterium]
MTRVVQVPASFDDRSFDQFAEACGEWPPDARLLIDARQTQWFSPYGLVGLLTAGQALKDAGLPQPLFTAPQSDDVKRYLARTGFFAHAEGLFEIHGRVPKAATGATDALLDIRAIRAMKDVHEAVRGVSDNATRILVEQLGINPKETYGFGMALSEACQNIVEHAGAAGWVAVQSYTWRRRLGRRVVVIAVSDSGVGFRHSLEATHARQYGERWGDGAAIEAALIQNVSRFRDPGRGQGLAFIKRFIHQWNGKISIRSGTARLSIVPDWDDDAPLAEHLPRFPGAQVQITIPAPGAAAP